MASKDRRSARDLIAEIGADGPRFRFFQAVRLLALADRERPTLPAVRFGSPLTLGFPASEITSAEYRQDASGTDDVEDDRAALHLSVGFMGMIGPSAALPVAYTEALIERRNFHRDTAAHAFLDMFTHRSVSLFYQAWQKYRFHIGYEAGDRERFTRNMLDLVGAGLSSLHHENREGAVAPNLFSHFAGILSQKPISAANLASLLRGYFHVDVSIKQFCGQWIVLPAGEQTALGRGNSALGETTIVGARVWERQNKLTVRLGPMDNTRFSDFLPGRPGETALRGLVQFCIGQTLACDVALILKKECVRPAVLAGGGEDLLRLGYNIWLHSEAPPDHQDDACFTLLN